MLSLLLAASTIGWAQQPWRVVSAEADRHAADELCLLLRAGGVETLRIGTEEAVMDTSTQPTIFLGRLAVAHNAPLKVRQMKDSLHNDGYFIIGEGNRLYLIGKGEKGTLYAVYAFLEKLGYRLYTPTAMVLPDLDNNPQFSSFNFHLVENPAFAYREVAYYYPNHSQRYADWHHLHTEADREAQWGMFVHTFKDLLPADRYFDSHPEWYSLNNGRRSRDGQLCLSNPEVLDELCRRLADTMAAFPQKRIWAVSPNDNYNACQCDNCRRMDSIYGGQSGTLLHFVNQVARRFPDKTIATLAYQYTRQAPTVGAYSSERPDSNVLIMLCPIEAGREQPIATSPHAADFRKDMEDWAQACGHSKLFLWDYVVQFRNFWNPFPNLHVLQPNLQFFRDNGVSMMFEQASGADNITSWMDIRCYMIAKLLWNPDVDIDSVMADFYQGYYGEAGQYVKEIIDTMTAALVQSGQRLDIYGFPVDAADSYLSVERMQQYDTLMHKAFSVADYVVAERLEFFKMALLFARVELAAGRDLYGYTGKENRQAALENLLFACLDSLNVDLHRFEVPQMMEMGITPEQYYRTIHIYIEKLDYGYKPTYPSVTLRKPATEPYNKTGLSDGKVGIMDYRHNWVGFWGDTLDAMVDLGKPTELQSISLDFYFYPLSWIFLPQRVAFYASDDGEQWQLMSEEYPENPEILATPDIKSFNLWFPDLENTRSDIQSDNQMFSTRYLRIVAEPLPEIPSWHRAAGQKAWIFTDEIIVH